MRKHRLSKPVTLAIAAALLGTACTAAQINAVTALIKEVKLGKPQVAVSARPDGTQEFDLLFAEFIDDDNLGVDVDNYHEEGGFDDDGDGGLNYDVTAEVEVDGLGEHKVSLEQEDFPVMSDEDDFVLVGDDTTGEETTYGADQEFLNFWISDQGQKIEVHLLPDGTWNINGQHAKTTEEAANLLMQLDIIQEASVHGLSALYGALLQRQAPATLVPCNTGNNAPGWNDGPVRPTPQPIGIWATYSVSAAPTLPPPAELVRELIEQKKRGDRPEAEPSAATSEAEDETEDSENLVNAVEGDDSDTQDEDDEIALAE